MPDVVIVDDSHFMRFQIRDMLEEGGFTVVGEAENGRGAVETVRECDPDVVTMDVKMPGMDGIEAVERIMTEHPVPILMLSRYTEEGAEDTFAALEAGAVDFFTKPGGEVSPRLVSYKDDLIEKLEMVAQADVSSTVADLGAPGTVPEAERERPDAYPTVVIAASAGGPPEVKRVLGTLPTGLGIRTIVVQHMPGAFTDRFANHLEERNDIVVREATRGGRVAPDEVVVAKGGHHLRIDREDGPGLRYSLTDDPPVNNVRPAADVTMRSAAEVVSGPLVGVVLSGMGRDGAAGLERIKAAGGTTIVQRPETARIDGMPTQAIETGAVDAVVSSRDVAAEIVDHI